MNKQYITASRLQADAIELAFRVIDSGYRPDLMVGIWRGGTPVAITVQEIMAFVGFHCDHIAIRTASYTDIGERTAVTVHGMEYLQQTISADKKILLVDDVFDTGLSIDAVFNALKNLFPEQLPECRIATPYFKPDNNETGRMPDFHLFETGDWLVFPHELVGLSDREIIEDKPLPDHLKERLLFLKRRHAKRQ
jgi:hypoxanthine phosphoribosyltransferase